MRRWFVIFLIVLLPWRAWAADAMTMAVPGTTSPAAHCADHALQAAAPMASPDQGSDHARVDGTVAHAVCDVCNGPALAPSPTLPTVQAPLPQARQSTGPVLFASALLRAGRKPPIA
ncbi:hypothetical protein [Hydrogenophaga sp. RWCD_12]|uniref:hypothetical protein n=1 Tax=Hydrogenophaga sp. RWCD_12 TaxID=3391190 RepID=UPI003984ED79